MPNIEIRVDTDSLLAIREDLFDEEWQDFWEALSTIYKTLARLKVRRRLHAEPQEE